MDNKPLFFDYDYPSKVVKKRKVYSGIMKVLKKTGIKFQMPPTRIRIHRQGGPKIYGNPQEAAREMQERGFKVEMEEEEQEDALDNRIKEVSQWERNQETSEQKGTSQRARISEIDECWEVATNILFRNTNIYFPLQSLRRPTEVLIWCAIFIRL